MTSAGMSENRRILVIDDNVSIHEDFRKILAPPKDEDSLEQARVALFGEAPSLPPQVQYELEFASQGMEGLGLVQSALQQGRPFAMAFVDMRMPPGWDGLETIEHIRYADPDIEIVICTAYSDHPWEDIGRRIGNTDKLLILMKPFNSIEVVQIANALTKKWDLGRAVKQQLETLAFTVNQRTAELQEANLRLQENVSSRIAGTVNGQPQDGDTAELHQLEEFLAIMSHEIFTPMNELTGSVGQLLDSSLTSEQRKHVMTMQKCTHDLLALLKDMHEFMGKRSSAAAGKAADDASVTFGLVEKK